MDFFNWIKATCEPLHGMTTAEVVKKYPNRVSHMVVLHDEWCPILNGGKYCTCSPTVRHYISKGVK